MKQAAGDLADDDELKEEGKSHELAGKVNDTIDDVKDKANEVVDDVRCKFTG